MQSDAFRLSPDGILRCIRFLEFDWIHHGFGTRTASPPVDVTLRQIHSAVVWNAAGLDDREEEGDALISNQTDLHIGVRTADCVPLLLLDPQTCAVAAIHAGWRGTAAGIATQTVDRLRADFDCHAKNVRVAIGPSIRDCCYEVGVDVAEQLAPQFPEWLPLQGKRKIDLVEANRRQLLSSGVPAEHIYDSRYCTACSVEQLFSYRREPGNPGRMIASIGRLE